MDAPRDGVRAGLGTVLRSDSSGSVGCERWELHPTDDAAGLVPIGISATPPDGRDWVVFWWTHQDHRWELVEDLVVEAEPRPPKVSS